MPLSSRTRSLFRFSLGTLLFLTLCVCGYFAGYRRGFRAGDLARPALEPYLNSYSVADLIMPTTAPDTPTRAAALGDQLIEMIVDVVEPDTWMKNGKGVGEIQWYESNVSVIISQTQDVHERIGNLLKQLRSHSGTIEAYGLRSDALASPK